MQVGSWIFSIVDAPATFSNVLHGADCWNQNIRLTDGATGESGTNVFPRFIGDKNVQNILSATCVCHLPFTEYFFSLSTFFAFVATFLYEVRDC